MVGPFCPFARNAILLWFLVLVFGFGGIQFVRSGIGVIRVMISCVGLPMCIQSSQTLSSVVGMRVSGSHGWLWLHSTLLQPVPAPTVDGGQPWLVMVI